MDLARWLQANHEALAQQWLSHVQSRSGPWSPELEALMARFVTVFVSLLPASLGPLRAQVDTVWQNAAELYGSVAAMRGLAAGEVIEEFQGLREALIRRLYTAPPVDGREPVALREILGLNRLVDEGVSRASIGHTDAMFFALFQGSGMPPALTAQIMAEVHEQLNGVAAERAGLMSDSADG